MPTLRSKLVILALLPAMISAPASAVESQSSSIAVVSPIGSAAVAQKSFIPAPVARRASSSIGPSVGPLPSRPLRICTYLGCPGASLGGIGF